MILGIVADNKRHYDEIDIIAKDIDYISDTKKTRLLGVDGKVYRLTAKSYTSINKVLKKSKVG